MKLVGLLSVSFLLLSGFSIRAEEPDNQFVRIYNLIQQADASVEGGQSERARRDYLEAQEALRSLQKSHPAWNEKVIQFRLNYVAQKLNTFAGEGQPDSVREAPKPAAPEESVNQIKLLQEQIRQLSAERDVLQSKLKEALSAQPASVDPRELAKAEEKIKALQKEIEVFKVNLTKAEARPDKPIDPAVLEEAREALNLANQKLAQQSEIIAALRLEREALQNRLHALADGPEFKALREENAKLKSDANDLQAKALNEGKAGELKQQFAALQDDFAAQKSRNEVLTAEKRILEDRLKDLEHKRSGDLRARTLALEKELKEAHAEIQTKTAVVSELQTALRIAHEVKAKLEKENTDLETRLKASDADVLRRIEREQHESNRKPDAKELHGDKTAVQSASGEQRTNQVVHLSARSEPSQARKVSKPKEESSAVKPLTLATANTDTKGGRKSDDYPSSAAATLVVEGERAFSSKRFDEAEKKYVQALRADERNVIVLANLAAVQIEQNRLTEAESSLKRALVVDPQDAFSLSLLGTLKVRQHKFDEAFDALSRSAQLDPQNSDTFQYLGVTLAEKGMRDPAESAFRRAIKLSPGNGHAHHNLAVVYATQQPPAFELARWHYKKAVEAGHSKDSRLEKILNAAGAVPASN